MSRARGMELAGAIDTQCIGQDAGEVLACSLTTRPLVLCLSLFLVCKPSAGVVSSVKWHGMEEPLEIPVLNDLTMVLGSIAQVSIAIFIRGMMIYLSCALGLLQFVTDVYCFFS